MAAIALSSLYSQDLVGGSLGLVVKTKDWFLPRIMTVSCVCFCPQGSQASLHTGLEGKKLSRVSGSHRISARVSAGEIAFSKDSFQGNSSLLLGVTSYIPLGSK